MVANLDAKMLRFMSADEFRVLVAAEMGMKNHEIVPTTLIESISGLKRGGVFKLIASLAKTKLIAHSSIPYDGYRLTSKGYDYLALKAFSKRGTLGAMGIQIGVGKESDVFTVVTPEGVEVCLKLHRLGRTCFRTVKNNRDYMRAGQTQASWLYLSRLSALKEYAFMKALYAHGFPVPQPFDVNRHCVVMGLSHGYQLNSIQVLTHPAEVFAKLMDMIIRLAEHGLIHGDFNEFNLLIDDDENVTVIDFPQMISTNHVVRPRPR
jgi:RIO kinase 2